MWWNVFALQAECNFDEAGDPRRRFEVAEVGLD